MRWRRRCCRWVAPRLEVGGCHDPKQSHTGDLTASSAVLIEDPESTTSPSTPHETCPDRPHRYGHHPTTLGRACHPLSTAGVEAQASGEVLPVPLLVTGPAWRWVSAPEATAQAGDGVPVGMSVLAGTASMVRRPSTRFATASRYGTRSTRARLALARLGSRGRGG